MVILFCSLLKHGNHDIAIATMMNSFSFLILPTVVKNIQLYSCT